MGPRLDGVLRLGFIQREGRTYLADQYDQAPLKAVRPFSLVDGRVLLQIVNTTAGVLAGDAYRLDVTVGSGAKVVLVNQSATKAHTMGPGAFAEEQVRIQVAAGGELEFYPGLTIPFPGSDFRQTIDVRLDEGAKFGYLELRAMGRVTRGEHLAFRRMSCRVNVFLGETPCYKDALELDPPIWEVGGWGILEGNRYLASGYWMWGQALKHPAVQSPDVALVTGVPAMGHLYLRGMAYEGMALKDAVVRLLGAQRMAWGLAPLPAFGGLGTLPPPAS